MNTDFKKDLWKISIYRNLFLFSFCIILPCLLLWIPQAQAADNCIQNVWNDHGNKQSLTCTANDVRIAYADNIRDTGGQPLSQCINNQTFSFIADFHVELTATERYDLGLYFGNDGDPNGDGALTGSCDANVIFDNGTPFGDHGISDDFVQLDPAPDTCGDIDAIHNPQVITVRVDNVLCTDSDGDGYLNLPNCTSWRTSGQNDICTTSNDAYPGSPSKCNCNPSFNIPVFVETGNITVTKTVVPLSKPEPGGAFDYTVRIDNSALYTDVTIDRICDNRFGTIAHNAGPACPTGDLGTINSTTCDLSGPLVIEPQHYYECGFTASVSSEPTGDAGIVDIVTAFGRDENNTPVQDDDDAKIIISNVPPAASILKSLVGLECAAIRYKVEVTNTGTAEALSLTALTDDSFGSLTSVHDDVVSTGCSVPQSIAAGDTYDCEFVAQFCAGSHTDTATATLSDNEGGSTSPSSNSLTINVSAEVPAP